MPQFDPVLGCEGQAQLTAALQPFVSDQLPPKKNHEHVVHDGGKVVEGVGVVGPAVVLVPGFPVVVGGQVPQFGGSFTPTAQYVLVVCPSVEPQKVGYKQLQVGGAAVVDVVGAAVVVTSQPVV